MRTIKDDLDHCKIAIEMAMAELMAGRTFYEDYFKGQQYKDLSRTDRAICILQAYLGHQQLGDPEGFKEIRQHMHRAFLERKAKEKEDEYS